MMEYLTMELWSPYLVGIGMGILVCLAFLLSDRHIGCSAAFVRTSGMIEQLFCGDDVHERPYYQLYPPIIEWEWLFLAGIAIGSFLSAYLSGHLHLTWIPVKWQAAFGDNPTVRLLAALAGGTIMGFGARMTGGCTSGHGLSGTMQLAVSSWVAVICFFVSGTAVAIVLFHLAT